MLEIGKHDTGKILGLPNAPRLLVELSNKIREGGALATLTRFLIQPGHAPSDSPPISFEALPLEDLPSPCHSCPHAPSSMSSLWERRQEDQTLITALRSEIEEPRARCTVSTRRTLDGPPKKTCSLRSRSLRPIPPLRPQRRAMRLPLPV